MSDNHVFDCNSIQSLRIQGTQLLQTAGEVCRAWDDELLVIEDLLAAIPGDLRSPLLAESLDAFTHPLYRPELDDACCELQDTLTNLEANIPFIDRQAALTLDSLGEGMYSIITRADELAEEVTASYRKPELEKPVSNEINADSIRQTQMEQDLRKIDAAEDEFNEAVEIYARNYWDIENETYYQGIIQEKENAVARLQNEFRTTYHLSDTEFETLMENHRREVMMEQIAEDPTIGLAGEICIIPFVAAEAVQNQVTARTKNETDYSFLNLQADYREAALRNMNPRQKSLYNTAADAAMIAGQAFWSCGNLMVYSAIDAATCMDVKEKESEQNGATPEKAASTSLMTASVVLTLDMLTSKAINIKTNGNVFY